MKPTLKIAETKTPDGETLTLVQHDADFSMKVGCQELMTSRAHESELELARLGCARIAARPFRMRRSSSSWRAAPSMSNG